MDKSNEQYCGDFDKREKLRQYKRDYYERNRERIRERDNRNARNNRTKHPERHKQYAINYSKRHADDPPKDYSLTANPEKDKIINAINAERRRNK